MSDPIDVTPDDLGLDTDVMRAAVERLEGQPVPVMLYGRQDLDGMVGEATLSVDEEGKLRARVQLIDTDKGKAVQQLINAGPTHGFSLASKVERKGHRIVKADISTLNWWKGGDS